MTLKDHTTGVLCVNNIFWKYFKHMTVYTFTSKLTVITVIIV